MEIVDAQSFDAKRLRELQGIALDSGRKGGVHITKQEGTARYYASWVGKNNTGMGPAIVRIEVPEDKMAQYLTDNNIALETLVPSPPTGTAETETFLPFDTLDEFESFANFFLHSDGT